MTATATRGSLAKIRDDVVYLDHQLVGIRTMSKMGSLLLADDMGLGKTLEALTVAAIDFETGIASKILVITPASIKANWHDPNPDDPGEIQKFTHFTSTMLEGGHAERSAILAGFDTDILVVNYEQVRPHLVELNAIGFDIVIYDEAHAIKNPKAQRTKACQGIVARRHLLLTGSPLLNHVDDLWSLLHRIAPGEFPRYWSFLNRYAVFGGYKDKEIVGVKHQNELHEKLSTLMVRRRFDDVFDRSDDEKPLFVKVEVDLRPEQRALYKQAVDEMQIDLPSNPNPLELENALTRFLRLKQICGTTACIPGYPDESAKLDEATDRAVQIVGQGERLVMFTQFREVLACEQRRLEAQGINVFVLHGDVPTDERVRTLKLWSATPQPAVLIAMLQVGGIGLNMNAASKAFFLDKLFVPKLNDQAVSRLDRIGQTKRVQVFEFLCRNTIESRIELILRRKVKVFGELVEESSWKRRLVAALLEEDS